MIEETYSQTLDLRVSPSLLMTRRIELGDASDGRVQVLANQRRDAVRYVGIGGRRGVDGGRGADGRRVDLGGNLSSRRRLRSALQRVEEVDCTDQDRPATERDALTSSAQKW